MYFGALNTEVTLKKIFMEAFSRYQCSKFLFSIFSCFDVFGYILSSNWPICLNKHSNWRQLNPLQLFTVKFSDRPSSSDASNFNKLEIFAISILPRTICEFSTSICAKISNFSNLLKSLASELLGRSENFRIKSCRRFGCLQFERLFR